jgi:hypothetical protein
MQNSFVWRHSENAASHRISTVSEGLQHYVEGNDRQAARNPGELF